MRILLDTNVLVAAFATRGFCLDILQLVLAEHRLLVGETVLEELDRTLADKLHMPAARIEEVVTFIREHSDVVVGEADVLVTGDKDLLDARSSEAVRIVTPRGLWEMLRAGHDPDDGVEAQESDP